MIHIKEYNTFNANNRQEDLQKLAKQIFANGTIKEVLHHSYGTNHPDQTKGTEFVHVEDGSIAYTVTSEGFPFKYVVQMRGTTVSNITEIIEY